MSSQVTDEGSARTRYRLCDSLVGGIYSRERQSPKSARLGELFPPPNPKAHRPSMPSILSFVSLIRCMKRPSIGLNAAICPLPNIPTRSSWLNSPKSPGAMAIPHGALNHGPGCNRANLRPAVSKTTTAPNPTPATSSSRLVYVLSG
jgi:hypothetical protein